jgi:hypothetical protein
MGDRLKRDYPWRWQPGDVDESQEHLELQYADLSTQKPETSVRVALVSAPVNHTFQVQFLIDEADDAKRIMVQETCKELDLYLFSASSSS